MICIIAPAGMGVENVVSGTGFPTKNGPVRQGRPFWRTNMTMKITAVPMAVLLAVLLTAGGRVAFAAQPACGDVIVADTVLEANLDCPPFTDGLIIGANGITLDLNGFAISGALAGAGVLNIGYKNVTVKNGAISGFRDGVRAYRVGNLTLGDLAFFNQRYSSIVIIDAREVRVSRIFVSLPPGGGAPDPVTGHVAEAIRFAQVDSGTVADVLVEGGYFGVLSIGEPRQSRDITIVDSYFDDVQTGIRMINNVDARVGNNRVTGTEFGEGCYSGIDIVDQASHNIRVQDNIVRGCGQGIFAASDVPSSELTIRDNEAYLNGVGILLLHVEDSNLLGNHSYLNEFAGLALVESSTDNRIEENIATGNGLFDMFHDESSTPNRWRYNICDTSEGADIDCP